MYTIPVMFLLAASQYTIPFTLRVSEPVVACIAHYHALNGPVAVEVHFKCYTEEGKIIHRFISGVQKT
jgi:hypothetical protein